MVNNLGVQGSALARVLHNNSAGLHFRNLLIGSYMLFRMAVIRKFGPMAICHSFYLSSFYQAGSQYLLVSSSVAEFATFHISA